MSNDVYVKFSTRLTKAHPEAERVRKQGIKCLPRIVTECVIYASITGDSILVTGKTYLNPHDNHVKALGQKYALAKALESLPRCDRKKYWDWFFNRSKGARNLRRAR